MLLFSGIAVAAVWLAGRRDSARDPRLTTLCLVLLAAFPLLGAWLPKVPLLPTGEGPGVSNATGFGWMKMLEFLWLAGFGVAGLRLLSAARGIALWRARSELLGLEDGVEIRLLVGLRGPVAAGVWRRVVFVPAAWRTWSTDTRRMVLAHELAHHRRHDPLRRWVAELACAINWFNPAVVWMARRLAMQCEFACDAAVLHCGVDARAYAGLLCDCARDRAPRGLVLAMTDGAGLEARVRRLAKPTAPAGRWTLAAFFALTLAAAGTLALLGPAKPPIPVPTEVFTPQEVETRWSANPFPGGE